MRKLTFRNFRNNNSSYYSWGKPYYWLFASGTSEANTSWFERRTYQRKWTYYIPNSEREAADLTLDFIIAELNQAGYKAVDIVTAIEQLGNFKGRVKVRVIT